MASHDIPEIRWLIAALILAVALTGCAAQGRTSLTPNPAEDVFPAPEYEIERPAAFRAAVDAAFDYFKRVDKRDEQKGYLFINNNAFWAGDTDVEIWIHPKGENRIWVEIVSRGAGGNQPLYNRSENDIRGYVEALDKRMGADHPNLNPLPPKQKPARAGGRK